MRQARFIVAFVLGGLFGGLAWPLLAAVLPEDRADALYHSYDGGGVEITGPSFLLRKQAGTSSSLWGNYYVDSVTSASIDVVTSASPYEEERIEKSVGVDYLRGKTIMSLAYTNSEENDYSANSAHFGVSQSVFGDLTTISLGYSLGWDEVRRNNDPNFEPREVDRQHYRLGVSQILTRDLLLDLAFETITDEGYLNNPYRSVRYLDPGSPLGYSRESEVYPNTRTSNAVAVRAKYYLPYRAAAHAEYRFFTDDWGIDAHTAELGYTHPFRDRWILDLKYRYYAQTAADFYSDLFPYAQAQNYLARDKELSQFTSHTVGVGLSYEFARNGWGFIDKGTLNASLDYMRFEYDDFRDIRVQGVTPGTEPLYEFSANVLQLYVSIWY